MVAALRNDFTEGFQNQSKDEFSVDHYLDKFQNSMETVVDEENIVDEEEGPMVDEENLRKERFQNSNELSTDGEDIPEEDIPEEDIPGEEEADNVMNDTVVEGFNGSKVIELNNEKVWLKSIMFGLLFYILSNPKIYDLTKGLSSQINKHVLHTIIFVVITYLLLLII